MVYPAVADALRGRDSGHTHAPAHSRVQETEHPHRLSVVVSNKPSRLQAKDQVANSDLTS